MIDVTGRPIGPGRASGLASAGTFAAYEVDRSIGNFVAERGRRYTLAVETHMGAAALQPFSPRLRIQPSSSMIRDEYLTTLVTSVIGGGIGMVGLALLGFAWWLNRQGRSKTGASSPE